MKDPQKIRVGQEFSACREFLQGVPKERPRTLSNAADGAGPKKKNTFSVRGLTTARYLKRYEPEKNKGREFTRQNREERYLTATSLCRKDKKGGSNNRDIGAIQKANAEFAM